MSNQLQRTNQQRPILAREGWPFIVLALILTIIAAFINGYLGLVLALVAIFVIQFFRDPARQAPSGDTLVLSPADGRIVAVEEVDDLYARRRALKISVFMNVFNVHSNQMPVGGRISKIEYHQGKFVNADLDKASVENERNAIVIERADGQLVTSVQVAGLVARRILCYVTEGETLQAAARYGFIRFGSRVDVYLPLHAKPLVAIGDKVSHTTTVLAELE
ncbi:Phosphatidylserine decarboxylase proenzyme [Oligella sp. MSHR50489EDL]|uniref:phosphatidylserine decarboxylase n=1 Tax=Oligella sp. MSHR50489EDL TaxID=3139409 RepID=UPI003D81B7B1